MMIYRPLPDTLEYQGKPYHLTLSFDRVLEVLYLQGEPLEEFEKLDLSLCLLIETEHDNDPGLLQAVFDLLFDSKKIDNTSAKNEKCLDYIQDAGYIYAAFRQAYGINLYEEQGKLHWLEFVALLNALPSDTRLMEIVQIRLRPLPKPNKHNAEEIKEILKQKAAFKLPISDEERKEQSQSDLSRLVSSLERRAKKNGHKKKN